MLEGPRAPERGAATLEKRWHYIRPHHDEHLAESFGFFVGEDALLEYNASRLAGRISSATLLQPESRSQEPKRRRGERGSCRASERVESGADAWLAARGERDPTRRRKAMSSPVAERARASTPTRS